MKDYLHHLIEQKRFSPHLRKIANSTQPQFANTVHDFNHFFSHQHRPVSTLQKIEFFLM